MTLMRRIERLERVSPAFYSDVSEIPTPVLVAMVRLAWREDNLTQEDRILYQQLQEFGFKL